MPRIKEKLGDRSLGVAKDLGKRLGKKTSGHRAAAQPPWTLYYNPHCGTCLKVKERLESRGVQPKIVEYMKDPLSVKTLERILKKMGLGPAAITRFKEPFWMEKALDPDRLGRKEWLEMLAEHPFLIQRPIVETKERAVVARPPEETDSLFSEQ
ncbi:MAG: arsenate reductase (glutaredoxin) [Elusimicrobia bacterium]|nr:arsenate reductase (glutaredoxin) [Elusimicrobiota bacterium]